MKFGKKKIMVRVLMLTLVFMAACTSSEENVVKPEDENAYVIQFKNAVKEVGKLHQIAKRIDGLSVSPDGWRDIRDEVWDILDWAEEQRVEGVALLALEKPNFEALSLYTRRLIATLNQNVMDRLVALDRKKGGE